MDDSIILKCETNTEVFNFWHNLFLIKNINIIKSAIDKNYKSATDEAVYYFESVQK